MLIAALSSEEASMTTTLYVPAVKPGAGPNAPPSTEKVNGAVPQSTASIANVPFV